MRKPSHPGEVLLSGYIETHNVKIKALAEHLGFSRETLSRVLHGKTPMTANLALSLEEAGISTARLWLALQTKYDLWQLKTHRTSQIKPFFSQTKLQSSAQPPVQSPVKTQTASAVSL